MEKEFRTLGTIEVRDNQEDNKRILCGYACRFNSESHDLGGFTEIISPNAFDGVLDAEGCDVIATKEHTPDPIYARYRQGFDANTLTLRTDENGLYFEFEAPSWDSYLYESVRSGNMTDCSFAFVCESDTWDYRADGTYLRTINKVKNLYDIAICLHGAYPQPQVSCRSFEEFKAEQERIAQEKRNEEEAKKAADLKEYYEKLIIEQVN